MVILKIKIYPGTDFFISLVKDEYEIIETRISMEEKSLN